MSGLIYLNKHMPCVTVKQPGDIRRPLRERKLWDI